MSDDAIITRLELLMKYLEEKLICMSMFINPDAKYIKVVYCGLPVCKIVISGNGYDIEYNDRFLMNGRSPRSLHVYLERDIPVFICSRVNSYKEHMNKKEQEVKNMINKKHFIVEKMEVEQKCGEPDVINMTVRQEPDGIPFQTGRELKTLIESLDPDKLSSDYRINVNVDNNTVQKAIYMMARGNGKTQYVSELLKNKTVVYNGNIHTNIENVIFNDPATIVFWTDGSKTVVKCQPRETFDPEKGLAMAISKKVLGNDYDYYETFAKYVGRYNKKRGKKNGPDRETT